MLCSIILELHSRSKSIVKWIFHNSFSFFDIGLIYQPVVHTFNKLSISVVSDSDLYAKFQKLHLVIRRYKSSFGRVPFLARICVF